MRVVPVLYALLLVLCSCTLPEISMASRICTGCVEYAPQFSWPVDADGNKRIVTFTVRCLGDDGSADEIVCKPKGARIYSPTPTGFLIEEKPKTFNDESFIEGFWYTTAHGREEAYGRFCRVKPLDCVFVKPDDDVLMPFGELLVHALVFFAVMFKESVEIADAFLGGQLFEKLDALARESTSVEKAKE
jgi:hypothetical protein